MLGIFQILTLAHSLRQRSTKQFRVAVGSFFQEFYKHFKHGVHGFYINSPIWLKWRWSPPILKPLSTFSNLSCQSETVTHTVGVWCRPPRHRLTRLPQPQWKGRSTLRKSLSCISSVKTWKKKVPLEKQVGNAKDQQKDPPLSIEHKRCLSDKL